eukprot:gnl/Dysnectes_brevis/98_a118_4331.p1 GENE.gnl/Dysnectes_brevis/98_a118_4331~~gnl/Dysnectes_brevis/98_a118_4331.p1  ORF type:complete len:1360 (+),score=358.64 gnl/Dysnectes_brevis/98_a118_4331:61-4080(+)
MDQSTNQAQFLLLRKRNPLTTWTFWVILALYAACVYLSSQFYQQGSLSYSLLSEEDKLITIPEWKIKEWREFHDDPEGMPPAIPTTTYHIATKHEVFGSFQISLYLFFLPTLAHVGLYLARFWIVRFRARNALRPSSPPKASQALIIPGPGQGKPVLCPVHHVQFSRGDVIEYESYVLHQQVKMVIDGDKLVSLEYPVALTKASYYSPLAAGGVGVSESLQLRQHYGSNGMLIPVPSFLDLFLEHAMAPFFVFQIFCCILWCLDDFAMFSIFTLVMLGFMEAATVFQRRNAMAEIRKMAPRESLVDVLREGKWVTLPSSQLLPGDIMSFNAEGSNAAPPPPVKPTRPVHPLVRMLKGSQMPEQKPARSPVAPADLLLLAGGAVADEALLTGEAAPQIKDPLCDAHDYHVDGSLFNVGDDKVHVVYAGTRLVTASPPGEENVLLPAGVPRQPRAGPVFYVLRTGFGTQQGELVRSIAFDRERMSANNKDAMQLMLGLLVFAIVASVYTFIRGKAGEICPMPHLVLQCLLIFVSVIPPELPVELSLSVTAALGELRKKHVYCTEPFRVPLAGVLRVCCFDKTGTLTNEKVDVLGIAHPEQAASQAPAPAPAAAGSKKKKTEPLRIRRARQLGLVLPEAMSASVRSVLGGCHSLVLVKKQDSKDKSKKTPTLTGDPLEVSAFETAKWKLQGASSEALATATSSKGSLRVLRRYPFSSKLKRMAVIASDPTDALVVLAKGAPEVLESRMAALPEWYHQELHRLTLGGYRVLALAHKRISKPGAASRLTPASQQVRRMLRDDAESDLTFLGFLVCDSPLKQGTVVSIRTLKQSAHRCVMITGDNVLTAAAVGRRAGLVPLKQDAMVLESVTADTATFKPLACLVGGEGDPIVLSLHDLDHMTEVARTHALCVSGEHVGLLLAEKVLALALVPRVRVWARTSPQEKTLIVRVIEDSGLPTGMCGDGGNDVGALKGASVGVALFETPDFRLKKAAEKNKAAVTAGAAGTVREGVFVPSVLGAGGRPATDQQLIAAARERSSRKGTSYHMEFQALVREQIRYRNSLRAQQSKLMGGGGDAAAMWNEAFAPELNFRVGDASIAAPFTSKSGRLGGFLDIIRQGRCTLLTTLQTYKTMALQCIVGAYSMTVLTLDGVRSSNPQMMISSALSTTLMMSVSRAKPLERISAKPAPSGVASPYLLGSLIGQLLLHCFSLWGAAQLVKGDSERVTVPFETEFAPSLMNTVVFLVGMCQDLSITLANYTGAPYMQPIRQYPRLLKTVAAYAVACVVLCGQVVPALNEAVGLVSMSDSLRNKVLVLGAINVVGCMGVEKIAMKWFGPKPLPKEDV